MSIDVVRHGRQIRLPEIGEAGQERLCASEVAVQSSNDAREIEAEYLTRSGIRVVAAPSAPAAPAASANGGTAARDEVLASLGVRDAAARDVAVGALSALVAIRGVLGIEE